MSMREYVQVAREAALEAGGLLVEMQHEIQAREKGPKDLVTAADLAAQQAIEKHLRNAFPDHEFLGEESPSAEKQSGRAADGFRWIVDPLDGTVNYAHGMPGYAVSIGLEKSGEILCGVVYDPTLKEVFHAARGEGAYLNGTPIRPSDCRELHQALVAASLPANVSRDALDVAWFIEVLHHARAVRRLGSAALNLCYVACGRLDCYWATSVKSWDVLAAALCCQEAGGTLTGVDGSPFELTRPQLLAAGTSQLHAEVLGILAATAR